MRRVPTWRLRRLRFGDANLDKEKSNNIDIYWRKTAGQFTLTANFFYNRIDDYVYKQEQDLNGDGIEPTGWRKTLTATRPISWTRLTMRNRCWFTCARTNAEFMGFEAETRARLMDTDQGRMVLRFMGGLRGRRTQQRYQPAAYHTLALRFGAHVFTRRFLFDCELYACE